MNKSIYQAIQREIKHIRVQQIIFMICQCQNQFDIGSIVEINRHFEIVPNEIRQLLDFNQSLPQNRKQLYIFNKMVFLPFHEHGNSYYFIDVSGQIVLSLTYGHNDKKMICTFKYDNLHLIQEAVCISEQYIMDKY